MKLKKHDVVNMGPYVVAVVVVVVVIVVVVVVVVCESLL